MSKYIEKHIKAVLLDHDDTLVGTIGPKWKQHKYIAKTYYNKVLTNEELRMHWGKPLAQLACLLYETNDVETAMANIVESHSRFPKEVFEATIPTLKQLKEAGMLIGIITATTRFSLDHDLELQKVPAQLIDYKQTSEDTNYHKPDPRVFDPALAWLSERDIQPAETLYIGDGLLDMEAAVGAGVNFLGVQTGLITAEDFNSAKAISIPSLAHLYS
jgi:phosphoglycolate phosphatase-like HAD superfamily hydrolase